VSPAGFAGAPATAEAEPASALISCIGCVYHSSYYGMYAEQACHQKGGDGQRKAYWREYGCFPRDNGAYYDLRVRWNA
jgi:hypothetical protein